MFIPIKGGKSKNKEEIIAPKLPQPIAKKANEKELYTEFEVANISDHELKKAVAYAKKEELFDKYSGLSAKDLKDDAKEGLLNSDDRTYEVDFDYVINHLDIMPEDPTGLFKITATIEDQKFFIGYAPKSYTKEIRSLVDILNDPAKELKVKYQLEGGKYKTVDYEYGDYDGHGKIVISQGFEDYRFTVQIYADRLLIKKIDNQHISHNSNVQEKSSSITNKTHVKVVGVTFTNAKQILSNVLKDNGGFWNVGGTQTHKYTLSIKPDPDNEYDKNAIAVWSHYPTPAKARIKRSGRIGYLPKGIGIKLNEETKVNAIVTEGYGKFGITVDLSGLDKQ